MSVALYISFESGTSADKMNIDGKLIAPHIDNVSAIAEDAGLKRLDEFVSQSVDEVFELMKGYKVSKEQVEQSHSEAWFEPAVGLELVQNYLELVESYHSLTEKTRRECTSDLEVYEHAFKLLVKEGVRWHFSYDY